MVRVRVGSQEVGCWIYDSKTGNTYKWSSILYNKRYLRDIVTTNDGRLCLDSAVWDILWIGTKMVVAYNVLRYQSTGMINCADGKLGSRIIRLQAPPYYCIRRRTSEQKDVDSGSQTYVVEINIIDPQQKPVFQAVSYDPVKAKQPHTLVLLLSLTGEEKILIVFGSVTRWWRA
jgi:hypothetical protein